MTLVRVAAVQPITIAKEAEAEPSPATITAEQNTDTDAGTAESGEKKTRKRKAKAVTPVASVEVRFRVSHKLPMLACCVLLHLHSTCVCVPRSFCAVLSRRCLDLSVICFHAHVSLFVVLHDNNVASG